MTPRGCAAAPRSKPNPSFSTRRSFFPVSLGRFMQSLTQTFARHTGPGDLPTFPSEAQYGSEGSRDWEKLGCFRWRQLCSRRWAAVQEGKQAARRPLGFNAIICQLSVLHGPVSKNSHRTGCKTTRGGSHHWVPLGPRHVTCYPQQWVPDRVPKCRMAGA